MHGSRHGDHGALVALAGAVPGVRHVVIAGARPLCPAAARQPGRRPPVLIRLGMRRFRCQNPDCGTVTFAGQADGLTARYQRCSEPLARLLARVAPELAGRAGARLAAALGVAVHRSTLLRLVMTLPEPALTAAPEILGVDDFALRRGHVYGTILVDAATGQAIDLLPGRDAGPLADWLTAHPGAGSISLRVFPPVPLVGLSGREAVAEGDGEGVERRRPRGRNC